MAGFVLVGAKLLRRLDSRPSLRLLLAAVTCIVITLAWTFLAIGLTGGYALAFDANPLYCWLVGAVAGMSIALRWPRRHVGDPNAAA